MSEGDPAVTVRTLAEPLVAAADVDLVDVQVKGSGSRRLVRVVVDCKGGVSLGACQALSRQLSAELDEADPFPARYTLEVTSPGVDHPLQGQADFDRVEGRVVLVHRAQPDGRVTQVHGAVVAAEPEAVVLDFEGVSERVPYAEIVKATQRLPW